jgi:nucleoside-diphosphate-sugar epimerase
MRVLVIGCGYVGLPLAAQLARLGHEVIGIRRSSAADELLKKSGVRPLRADITRPEELASIELPFDLIVNLVSSSKGGLSEYRKVYLEGTRTLVHWLRVNPPVRYIQASSTSVYGQTDGSWVTEESPTIPASATAQVLVEAENVLRNAYTETGFPAILLRIGGIYGPERGHLFHQHLRGEATIRDDGKTWLNMVHLDDVIGSIIHLILKGEAGQIYNLVDNEPVTQLEFFNWLSQKLGKALPPSSPADPTRKRGVTNKRVSNLKLRKQTGYAFKYPTFRDGYAAEIHRLGVQSSARGSGSESI